MSIKDWFKSTLKRFFSLDKYDFEKLIIEREVIETIIELAQQTYPKEFIAFLEGRTKKKVLRITGLAYQEYVANQNSALSKVNFPLTSNNIGSVHSHPGYSNRPSRADLHFFSKRGMVHLIIKKPHRAEDIQGYDMDGGEIEFDVV